MTANADGLTLTPGNPPGFSARLIVNGLPRGFLEFDELQEAFVAAQSFTRLELDFRLVTDEQSNTLLQRFAAFIMNAVKETFAHGVFVTLNISCKCGLWMKLFNGLNARNLILGGLTFIWRKYVPDIMESIADFTKDVPVVWKPTEQQVKLPTVAIGFEERHEEVSELKDSTGLHALNEVISRGYPMRKFWLYRRFRRDDFDWALLSRNLERYGAQFEIVLSHLENAKGQQRDDSLDYLLEGFSPMKSIIAYGFEDWSYQKANDLFLNYKGGDDLLLIQVPPAGLRQFVLDFPEEKRVLRLLAYPKMDEEQVIFQFEGIKAMFMIKNLATEQFFGILCGLITDCKVRNLTVSSFISRIPVPEMLASPVLAICKEITVAYNQPTTNLNIENGKATINLAAEYSVVPILSLFGALISTGLMKNLVDFKVRNPPENLSQEDLKTFVKYIASSQLLTNVEVPGIANVEDGDKVLAMLERNQNVQLYKDAVCVTKVENYGRAKLMVIGKEGAGKTSTINSLLGITEAPESTIVANAGVSIVVDVNDPYNFTRQENENPVIVEFNTAAKAIVDDIETFKPIIIRDKQAAGIAGNLINFSGDDDLGATLLKLSPSEESAAPEKQENKDGVTVTVLPNTERYIPKDSVRFSVWDFGGVELFTTLHHCFLSNEGVFLVVFDLEDMIKDMDKEVQELENRIHTISFHAPKSSVFVVGTKAANISEEQLLEIDEKVEEIFEESLLSLGMNLDASLHFFPIDNATAANEPDQINQLKKSLVDLFSGASDFRKDVPMAWIYFMQKLFKEDKLMIPRDEVMKKAIGFDFKPADVTEMLGYFNKIGIILSFENDKLLEEFIVLRPQQVLAALASLVYDKRRHRKHALSLKGPGETRPWMAIYEKKGLLELRVFEYCMKQQGFNPNEIKFIKNLCEQMGIFSRYPFDVQVKNQQANALEKSFWLVPVMNRQVFNEKKDAALETGKMLNLKISFDNVVPQGTYNRLVCLLLKKSVDMTGSLEPSVYDAVSKLYFGQVGVVFRKVKDNEFELLVDKADVDGAKVVVDKINEVVAEFGATFNPSVIVRTPEDIACKWSDLQAALEANSENVRVYPSLPEKHVEVSTFSGFKL